MSTKARGGHRCKRETGNEERSSRTKPRPAGKGRSIWDQAQAEKNGAPTRKPRWSQLARNARLVKNDQEQARP